MLTGETPQNPTIPIDDARIFPFWAAGGGWESTIRLVNIAEDEDVEYTLRFYTSLGQPAIINVRDRNGLITSTSAIEGELPDDGGAVFVLLDTGALQTGWARLEYDGDDRIGGVVVFRQRVSGRPDFEAAVPISRAETSRFWFPFDNTQGFATTIAMTNTSLEDTNDITLRCWDFEGEIFTTQTIRLSAATTVSFSLPERYPDLMNRAGQCRVEGTDSEVTALALRFNPFGAFAYVPVFTRD